MLLTHGFRIYSRQEEGPVPCFPSARLTMAFLQFTGCICLYLMRVNISVALVCMTETPNSTDVINGTTVAPLVNSTVTTVTDTLLVDTKQYGENLHASESFQWSRQLKGWILSSFFVGYLMTQVPMGWMAPRLGGKWPLFTGMAILIAASLVSPAAANISPYLLIVVQVIKGFACGPYYPCVQHLWGYWAPPLERSKLTAFAMSGSAIGSVLSFFFSGLLCDYGFAGGWPSVFYVYALISVVWLIGWGIFVFDTPDKHPRISTAERDYIQRSLGPFGNSQLKTPPIPWLAMLTSPPFYAIIITDFAYQWGWYTAQTSLPQYMNDVLKFDIAKNGVASSFPYLASWLIAIVASVVADLLLEKKIASIVVVRKIFTTFGVLVPAFFVVAVGYLDAVHSGMAVAFLTVAVGLMGCIRAGHVVNQLDIAPRFGGVVMGVSNSMGTIAGIIAPSVTSSLTANGTQKEWQSVFYVCGAIFFVGWLVFTILARGEIQPWAIVSDDTDLLEENVPYEKNNFQPEIAYTSSPSPPPDGGTISHRSSSSESHFENEAYEGSNVFATRLDTAIIDGSTNTEEIV